MESSVGVGFMAVFAVTGSVVILSHQIHKRLLSDFMKDIEFELGGGLLHSHGTRYEIGSVKRTSATKKTVRFADDVVEPSSNNKEYRKKHLEKQVSSSTMEIGVPNCKGHDHELEDTMPPNRQALYRGIIAYKSHKGQQHVY